MLRYLPYVLSLALTVYCLIDAIQTDEIVIRNLPKVAWILLILLFPVVGPVAWLVAGRPDKNAATAHLTQQERWEADYRRREREKEQRERRRPPRGPDDDPEFLGNL